MTELPKSADDLVDDWLRRVRESQFVHYETGAFFSRLNYFLGIPSIALSATVGTAVFASLSEKSTDESKILLGLISITAAVLTSLQTFLRLSERADRHRNSAAGFSTARRSLEYLKSIPPNDEQELRRTLNEIRAQMDALAKEAPEVPSRMKRRLDKEIKNRERKHFA